MIVEHNRQSRFHVKEIAPSGLLRKDPKAWYWLITFMI